MTHRADRMEPGGTNDRRSGARRRPRPAVERSTIPAAAAFVAAAVSFGAVLAGAAGCSSARVKPGGDAQLRTRIAELERERDELAARLAEVEAALASVTTGAGGATDAERALAMLPRPVELRFDRTAQLRDADGDGTIDQARCNLRPLDGRGRFVQAVGTLDVVVTGIAADGAGGSVELGAIRLDADALRDAYVGGVLDVSYAIEIPIDAAALARTTGAATISANLRDVRTPAPVSATRNVERRTGG